MAIAGTRVLGGRYALTGVIGTGGMATVWRATDELLGREVAVKILHPQYAADSAFFARFEREARNVAGLNNARIVTVFDSGVHERTPYIVMELIEGRTLREVLDERGTLSPGDAVAIAAAVCEALEAAHAAGLVHRDIKPANIVLAGPEVKVLDFGIARTPFPAGGTRTQAVLGTAAYLSPEQAAGESAGPEADLYALGCVFYEMLTGSPPFAGESEVAVAYRQVHDNAMPPSSLRAGLSPRLDLITLQLLAKDPAHRPAGAIAARAGLLAALGPDQTTVLAPQPASDQVTRPAGRHRGRWRPSETILSMGLVAALAALAVVLITQPAAKVICGSKSAGSAACRRGTAGSTPKVLATQSPSAAATPSATAPATGAPSATPGVTTPAAPAPGASAPVAPSAAAAAAGTLVSDLEAGVAAGEVSQQAGQNIFSQLQQLLFNTSSQNPAQVEQQYAQLVEVFDTYSTQNQVTGSAVATIHADITALGAALGAG